MLLHYNRTGYAGPERTDVVASFTFSQEVLIIHNVHLFIFMKDMNI